MSVFGFSASLFDAIVTNNHRYFTNPKNLIPKSLGAELRHQARKMGCSDLPRMALQPKLEITACCTLGGRHSCDKAKCNN